MKKEWADKWVAALRSGKYKQGRFRLKSKDDKYCCLGVLCEIVGATEAIGHNGKITFDGSAAVLPSSVMEETGVVNNSGYNLTHNVVLATTNDRGSSFAEIANMIESYYETF